MSYSQDNFNEGFQPWRQTSVSLSKKTQYGSVIGRLNHGDRFGSQGEQFEVDAYPSLREGTYVYLNLGYSNTSIFPKYRAGGELYQSLPQAWEASLGFRYLDFETSKIAIYTGTVGKYVGNYYFLVRGNWVPDSIGSSGSISFQVRRYIGDENYVGLSVASGRSVTQIGTSEFVAGLTSQRASLDLRYEWAENWIGKAGLGYEQEEIRQDVTRIDQSFSLGIERRF